MAIRIDYSNMMDGAVAGGVSAGEWAEAASAFRDAYRAVERLRGGERRDAGAASMPPVGFFDLPANTVLLRQATDFAAEQHGRYGDIVVLGIGGSALGPIALRTALRPPGWNELSTAQRGGLPRLYVLDNIDPRTVAAVLDRVDLPRTLFIVTSKSGGTAETMAQYLIIHERLRRAHLATPEHHVVFVTDPAHGALRPLAGREGVRALDIPPNIGGRYSVLTPVGTLPAALIGIDVAALLAGAGDMVRRCATDVLRENPAGVFGTLQWLADTRHGRHVQVFMPYADALRDFAAWFVQLWAESLGKTRPRASGGRASGGGGGEGPEDHVGQTPLAALGATDQHSQVQLFMEGPADKTVTFVGVTRSPGDVDLEIPRAYSDVPELAYLGGHTLGELLEVERRATSGALARRGRPNLTITLDAVDEWHVGGLIMLLQIATAYAGSLYGINAFNQPGVELGKQFAYAELGRPDASAETRAEWAALPKTDPRWVV